MMIDTNCPYCDADIEINHDDGYGYTESDTHQQECRELSNDLERVTQMAEECGGWTKLSCVGQVKVGDNVRFSLGRNNPVIEVVASIVLHEGTEREEIVYNRKKNHYFNVSMAIEGTSSHKNVEYSSDATRLLAFEQDVLATRDEELEAESKRLNYIIAQTQDCLLYERNRLQLANDLLEEARAKLATQAEAINYTLDDLRIRAKLAEDDSLNISQGCLDQLHNSLNATQSTVDAFMQGKKAEWQPIETAPKGMKILVFYKNKNSNGRVVKAQYFGKYEVESGEDYAEYCEEKDEYYAAEGWYEIIDNWEDFSSVKIYQGEPTHWMPLPDAPNDLHPA